MTAPAEMPPLELPGEDHVTVQATDAGTMAVTLTPVEPEPLPDNEPELLVYANRLLREAAEIDGERGANDAALAIEVDRLRTLYGNLDAPLAKRRLGLELELERVYGALPQRGKKKSRALAFGVIGTRVKAARVQVDDQDALLVALKEHVEPGVYELIVRTVMETKVDHRALTNYVAANQWAPLPGTTIVEARDDFYAKTDPAADLRDYTRE